MAVTGKPRSGKNGRIAIGVNNLNCATDWTVTPHVVDLDATNFEGGGYEEHLNNVIGASVSLKLNWDAAKNPYDSPVNFQPGQFLTSVKLYINTVDNTFYTFQQLMVVQAPVVTNIKQMIVISVELVSDGTVTFPTGSV